MSLVWAAWGLLLWLACNCCGCAFGHDKFPVWLGANSGQDCYRHTGVWGRLLGCWLWDLAAIALGAVACRVGFRCGRLRGLASAVAGALMYVGWSPKVGSCFGGLQCHSGLPTGYWVAGCHFGRAPVLHGAVCLILGDAAPLWRGHMPGAGWQGATLEKLFRGTSGWCEWLTG